MILKSVYNLSVQAYSALVAAAGLLGNQKAALRSRGSRNSLGDLKKTAPERRDKRTVWFHCASMGEYEQALPVIKELKKSRPRLYIFVTYFSPAGYQNHKPHNVVDGYGYLPVDTPANARAFLNELKPESAVFVKYEFWLHFIEAAHRMSCPVISLSAVFRPGQMYFKPWGKPLLKALGCIDYFFVQNPESLDVLNAHGFTNAEVSGDTRFDRVLENAQKKRSYPLLEKMFSGKVTVIFGSAWEKEEAYFLKLLKHPDMREVHFIMAPHELSTSKMERLQSKSEEETLLFSQTDSTTSTNARVLIVDTIGELKYLYRFADIAVIGGGFNDGIHNVLEAAAYGIPVLFGPKHEHFPEAAELQELNCGYSFNDYEGFERKVTELVNKPDQRKEIQKQLNRYTASKKGAAEKAVRFIEQKLK